MRRIYALCQSAPCLCNAPLWGCRHPVRDKRKIRDVYCGRVHYAPPEQDKVVKEFLQLGEIQVSSDLEKFSVMWASVVRATAPDKLCQQFLGSADANIPM